MYTCITHNDWPKSMHTFRALNLRLFGAFSIMGSMIHLNYFRTYQKNVLYEEGIFDRGGGRSFTPPGQIFEI